MKFKGTSGKWMVSGGSEIVSMPLQVKISSKISGLSYEERGANLTAISAVPELIEALQDLVKYCEENDNNAELELAYNALNKAIEKALK